MKQLLKTVLQEEAKQAALDKVDDETCLIIVEWAMKFLPLKYRETMCEFFGKRGLSWHISAVVTKKDSRIEVECFVHIFNFCAQNNYAVVSIFEYRNKKECSVIGERVASQSEIFSCSQSTCVLTFKSERDAQAQLDSGKHVKELGSVSLYDTIRSRWAERVTGISNVAQEASAVFAHEESASSKTKASSMGWALKATQKRPRLEEKVKAYLIEKYEAGERSGTKADPLSVSREMKFRRDDKGELVFQPEEWKTAKTIKSFFSRYSAKLKQQGVSKPKDMGGSQPEVEEGMADDMEALEIETAMQNLRQAVYNDLKIPEHPSEVNQLNICKLMQEGKLKTLKLQDLKAICTTIGLTTEGPQARKKSFVEPLKEVVKKCTCKGSSDVY